MPKVEVRIEYGVAARANRGSYSGKKIHRLCCTYVIGLEDGEVPAKGTYAAEFARTGRPVLASCYPCCGCTSGQHAGRPFAELTADRVTCAKC